MYYVVTTRKSFEQASEDLSRAVQNNGFGVLHIHDLGATLRNKGVDFDHECRVFEVCNPQQAAKILNADMQINMALPCRISVYTESGQTKIGMIKPAALLQRLSKNPILSDVAKEVEETTIKIIDEGAN